ncbi:MAG: ion channel [Candidatus Korobacteraceae bacterium]|jgi:inward rectifier potassium channel
MVSRPQPLSEQDLRDLGFGSVVSRESHQRLLNRDGSFNVERHGRSFLESLSLYHVLLTMAWWQFALLVVCGYVVANTVFALAYLACGPGALVSTAPGMEQHAFLRAFFFSVETISTIGYGNVIPIGVPANLVVTLEALTGLAGFAFVTGLLFARFSRPTAKVLFSRHAVIAPYQNITALEFRVANARSNELIEISAKVMFSHFEQVDGVRTRRYYPLSLERDGVVFLPLTWTVVHPIDEQSPLHGQTPESLRDSRAEILVLLKAFDETFSSIVQTRTSFTFNEIIWGARFANAFMVDAAERFASGQGSGKKVAVDMRLFDIIEPVPDRLNR